MQTNIMQQLMNIIGQDKIKISKIKMIELTTSKEGQVNANQASKVLPQQQVQKQLQGKHLNAINPGSDTPSFQCQICTLTLPINHKITLQCQHYYCLSCLINCAILDINECSVIECPHEECHYRVDINTVQYLQHLPIGMMGKFRKYRHFMNNVNSSGQKTGMQVICPNENCEQGIIQLTTNTERLELSHIQLTHQQQPATAAEVACSQCHTKYCSRCLSPSHAQSPTQACQDWRTQQQQIKWLNNFKQCRKCNRIIEKYRGCNRVICKCGYAFCYKCESVWRHYHQCNPWAFDHDAECSEYLYYVCNVIMRVIWALLSIALYVVPMMVGFVGVVLVIVLGLVLLGCTYGYLVYCRQNCIKQINSCYRIMPIIIFPIGMTQGVMLLMSRHCKLIARMGRNVLKFSDLSLPFGIIPTQWLQP